MTTSLRNSLLVLAACSAALILIAGPVPAQSRRRAKSTYLRPAAMSGAYAYPALKWRVTLGMADNTTPAVADLDLDGVADIVLPAVDDHSLYRLTAEGRVVWKRALPPPRESGLPDATDAAEETAEKAKVVKESAAKKSGKDAGEEAATPGGETPAPRETTENAGIGSGVTGVTLGDVDRDGTLDILIAVGRLLLCYGIDGSERWRHEAAGFINSFPTIADIDADGSPEVIFGANDGRLHVLTGGGQSKWSFKTKSWIVGGAATGDLDGDGKLEVVFGSMDFGIYCLDHTGRQVWKFDTEDWIESSPVIADIDHDGQPDVVCPSDDGNLYCLSPLGTLKWSATFHSAAHQRLYPAVLDLNRDGTLETVLALPDGNLSAISSAGEVAWSLSVGGGIAGSPVAADLNNDGWQEIVVATTSGKLLGYNSSGGRAWEVQLGQTIEATPTIADLNRNGQYEIYTGNLMTSKRDSGFFNRYEISSAGGAAAWPTLKGDPYRTATVVNARDYGAELRKGDDYATAWEPFGAGYRPRTGITAPRRLRVTMLPLNDLKGNHDGALDPGETAYLRLKVTNEGSGASYESMVTIDVGESPLRLDRNRMYLGWIAPGATKTAVFRLTSPPISRIIDYYSKSTFLDIADTTTILIDNPAAAVAPPPVRGLLLPTSRRLLPAPVRLLPAPGPLLPGGRAPLAGPHGMGAAAIQPARSLKVRIPRYQNIKLQALESGVQAAVAVARIFTVPPLPPQLTVARRQIIDKRGKFTSGNSNGRLDSGETAILRVLLRNDNMTTAQTARVTIASLTDDVLVTPPQASLKDVVPYGGRQLEFAIRVARQLKEKVATLRLTTQTTAAHAAPATPRVELLEFPLGQLKVDTAAPQIALISPSTRIASTSSAGITMTGTVGDPSGIAAFRFDRQQVPIKALKPAGAGKYRFAFMRALSVGENVFPLSATDGAGNSVTLWVRVIRKPDAPTNLVTPLRSSATPLKARPPAGRNR